MPGYVVSGRHSGVSRKAAGRLSIRRQNRSCFPPWRTESSTSVALPNAGAVIQVRVSCVCFGLGNCQASKNATKRIVASQATTAHKNGRKKKGGTTKKIPP